MFAANTSYTDGNWHSFAIDSANLNELNELNPNKLRVQSSLYQKRMEDEDVKIYIRNLGRRIFWSYSDVFVSGQP